MLVPVPVPVPVPKNSPPPPICRGRAEADADAAAEDALVAVYALVAAIEEVFLAFEARAVAEEAAAAAAIAAGPADADAVVIGAADADAEAKKEVKKLKLKKAKTKAKTNAQNWITRLFNNLSELRALARDPNKKSIFGVSIPTKRQESVIKDLNSNRSQLEGALKLLAPNKECLKNTNLLSQKNCNIIDLLSNSKLELYAICNQLNELPE